MRTGRLIVCTLAIAGGLAVAAVVVPRAFHELHALRYQPFAVPHATAPASGPAPRPRLGHSTGPRAVVQTAPRNVLPGRTRQGGSVSLLGLVSLLIGAGLGLIVVLATVLGLRRFRHRRTRQYALYELHLSTHDQAKGQDLEDMVEAIANIVRAWPTDRARNGQPYLAFELIGSANGTRGPVGQMEWSLNVRCEPRRVTAIDGAISAASASSLNPARARCGSRGV